MLVHFLLVVNWLFFLKGSNLRGCRHFSISPICSANEKLLTSDNSGRQSDVAQPLPGNQDSGDSAAAERRPNSADREVKKRPGSKKGSVLRANISSARRGASKVMTPRGRQPEVNRHFSFNLRPS